MSATKGERATDSRGAGLIWSYGTAIGLGAFLLFEVQPLIARYILPWFGGSIEVWTTCMLFFQVMLLLGYLYAHLITRALSLRGQAAVHAAVLLAALAFLPVVPADRWRPSGAGIPSLRILLLLAATTGVPFFALSATSPLLQRWIATLRPGRNVYSLYALSNAGSLLALVTYPFVVEPLLSRRAQSWSWAGAFVAFVAVLAACAWRVWASGGGAGKAAAPGPTDPEPERGAAGAADRASRSAKGRRDAADRASEGGEHARVFWLLLPAAASMMLLASTNTICLEVVPFPLLWVLPLTLYLLTFIVCFAGERWYPRGVCLALGAASGVGIAAIRYGFLQTNSTAVQVGIYTVALFTCCMICHGETYRLRPPPERLTSFYLVISCGGALGGFLVAVVAPLVFPGYWELYVAMAVCLAGGVAAVRPAAARGVRGWRLARTLLAVAFLGGGLAMVVVDRGPEAAGRTLERSRNFYGTLRVLEKQVPFRADRPGIELALRELWNGPILHGEQFYDAARRGGEPGTSAPLPQVAVLRRLPTTYYGADSGCGIAMRYHPGGADAPRRIGVVGLGTGTLAGYGQPGDTIRYFEINPDVATVAERYFTFLADARERGVKIDVVLGDGRLSLQKEPERAFDILVVDAFSGDAIPVHMLTREAFTLDLSRLRDDGVLAVHVSNRHLSLANEVRRLAAALGVPEVIVRHQPPSRRSGLLPSEWVLLSRNRAFLDGPAVKAHMNDGRGEPSGGLPWTDDFSSVLRAVRW